MYKRIIKNFIGPSRSIFKYPILLNSYGRSGSTLLADSIVKSSYYHNKFLINYITTRSISQYCWEIQDANLLNGVLYKTHDYPPRSYKNNKIRMIYTFADPVDVIVSLLFLYEKRGESWMQKHADHLKITYNNFADIIFKDIFNLENHLDSWLSEIRIPIAFVRYESMWNYQKDISEFLGSKVKLPPYKKRMAKKIKDINLHEIEKSYSDFRNKVSSLNDFFILNGSNSII